MNNEDMLPIILAELNKKEPRVEEIDYPIDKDFDPDIIRELIE